MSTPPCREAHQSAHSPGALDFMFIDTCVNLKPTSHWNQHLHFILLPGADPFASSTSRWTGFPVPVSSQQVDATDSQFQTPQDPGLQSPSLQSTGHGASAAHAKIFGLCKPAPFQAKSICVKSAKNQTSLHSKVSVRPLGPCCWHVPSKIRQETTNNTYLTG